MDEGSTLSRAGTRREAHPFVQDRRIPMLQDLTVWKRTIAETLWIMSVLRGELGGCKDEQE